MSMEFLLGRSLRNHLYNMGLTNQVKDAMCVPSQALKFSPASETKKYDKQGVWIKTATGLKRYDVELGAYDDNKTQIISKEIKAGDKVVVRVSGKGKGLNKAPGGGRPPF